MACSNADRGSGYLRFIQPMRSAELPIDMFTVLSSAISDHGAKFLITAVHVYFVEVPSTQQGFSMRLFWAWAWACPVYRRTTKMTVCVSIGSYGAIVAG